MDINEIKLKAEELRSKIWYHNRKYYNEDAPEISDYEYDMLLRELENIEAEYPQLITPDSPTQRVGGDAAEKFSPVQHSVPMESLHDSFSAQEIRDFEKRVLESVDSPEFVVEPTAPCGVCRQAFLEFEKNGHPIELILAGKEKIYILDSFKDTMPLSFTEF